MKEIDNKRNLKILGLWVTRGQITNVTTSLRLSNSNLKSSSKVVFMTRILSNSGWKFWFKN